MSFLATSSSRDDSSSRSFIVKTTDKVDPTRIQTALKQISALEAESFNEVTLTVKKGIVSYKIGDREFTELRSDLPEADVKITLVKSQALPKSNRTLAEIRTSLIKEIDKEKPIVQFLFYIVFIPLLLLRKAFEGPRPDPKKMMEGEDFKSVIRWAIDNISDEDDSEFGIKNQLKEFENPPSNLAGKLLNRFNRAPSGKATNLLLLDNGYWEKGEYKPVLIAFYKTAEGKLAISEMTFSDAEGANNRDYVFKANLSEEQLKPLIGRLQAMKQKPEEIKGNPIIERFLSPQTDAKEPKTTPDNQAGNVRHRLISDFATEIERPNRRQVIREDPWKMMQEMIRLQFPETPTQNKVVFTLALLHEQLDQFVKGEDRLSDSEKREILSRLEKEVKSLERQLLKSPDASEYTELFQKFKSDVENLSKSINKTEILKPPSLQRLDAPQADPYEVKSEMKSFDHLSEKKVTSKGTLPPSQIELVDKLADGFDLDINTFKQLANEMEKMRAQKNYQGVIDLFNLAVQRFPRESFWHNLSVEQKDEWNKALVSSMQPYWESKIRLRQFPLSQTEKHAVAVVRYISGILAKEVHKPPTKVRGMSDRDVDVYSTGIEDLDTDDYLNKLYPKAFKSLLGPFTDIDYDRMGPEYRKIAAMTRSLVHYRNAFNPFEKVSSDFDTSGIIRNWEERYKEIKRKYLEVYTQLFEKMDKANKLEISVIDRPPYQEAILDAETGAQLVAIRPHQDPNKVEYYFGHIHEDNVKPDYFHNQKEVKIAHRFDKTSAEDLNSTLIWSNESDPVGLAMRKAIGEGPEEVLDLLLAHPEYLDKKETLFWYLIQTLTKQVVEKPPLSPEYVQNIQPILNLVLEQSLKTRNFARAANLLLIVQGLQKQSPIPLIPNQKEYWSQIVESLYNPNVALDKKLQIANAYVAQFGLQSRPFYNFPRDLNATQVGALLRSVQLLQLAQDQSNAPAVTVANLEWARQYLKPYLDKNPSLKSQAIDKWVSNATNIKMPGGYWLGDNTQLTKGDFAVDFENFQITKIEGKDIEGLPITLPSIVINNASFQALLGGRNLTVMAYPSTGEVVYKFIDQGSNYEIIVSNDEVKIVRDKGLYVGTDNRLGHLFRSIDNPTTGFSINGKERFQLVFDNKGSLVEVYSQRKILQNDPKLNALFSFLPTEKVLFLSDSENSPINEIRVQNQSIKIVRDNGKWLFSGGPYDKMEWAINHKWPPKINQLLIDLNLPIEQIGIPIYDAVTDSYHLIVWPNQDSPVKLTFRNDGRIESSASGYLFLANEFAKRHQYEKAALWLEKASTSRIENAADLDKIKVILKQFSEIPTTSARSAGIKIKAILTGQKIFREKVKDVTFNPEKPDPFISDRGELAKLYKEYQAYINKSALGAKSVQTVEETINKFGLNGEEIEAFIDLVEPGKMPIVPVEPFPSRSGEFLFLNLLTKMKLTKDEAFLRSLKGPDDYLVTHFFQLWNMIIKNPDQFDKGLLEGYAATPEIDQARKLLLAASKSKSALPFDLKDLAKFKNEIPESKIGMMWKFRNETKLQSFLSKMLLYSKELSLDSNASQVSTTAKPKIDPSKFGPNVTQFLAIPGNKERVENALEERINPTNADVISIVKELSNLDLIKERRQAELFNEIERLERFSSEPAPAWPARDIYTMEREVPPYLKTGWKNNPKPLMTRDKIKTAAEKVKTDYGFESGKAVDKLNNRAKLHEQIVDPNELGKIESSINDHRDKLRIEGNRVKSRILSEIKGVDRSKLSIKLQNALKNYDESDKEVLLELILDAYQVNGLNDELNQSVLHYLQIKTEENMFGLPAQKWLNQLKFMKENGIDETEWNIASLELNSIITQASNRTRYLNEEARLARKYLVAEYRNGIILSEAQTSLIKQIDNNPNDWFVLTMGEGKTSVILPIVLLLIADKGEMAVGIVKKSMLNQNLDSLDSATRTLIERAGVEFDFTLNNSLKPLALAEIYLKLLRVKSEKGYVVSTIEAKAALEHRIYSVLKKIEKNEDKINELEFELHWLRKIRTLIKSGQSMGDEVDDIINVVNENNLGMGKKELDKNLCRNMKEITEFIFSNPNFTPLKNAILNNSQAEFTLTPELLLKLVTELKGDPGYILGEETLPPGLSNDEVIRQTALKKLINRLPMALSQKRGFNVGVKDNGYMIGPLARTEQLENTFFSKEEDVVINHYLTYAVGLPLNPNTQKPSPIIQQAWSSYYENSTDGEAENIAQAARDNKQSPIDYLNSRPELYKTRLEILQRYIVERDPSAPGSVSRSAEQYVLNVQELVIDEKFGGMTGTIDAYALPHSSLKQTDKAVDVEVLIRSEMIGGTTVEHVPEKDYVKRMGEMVKLKETRAIVNESYAVEGKNIEQLAEIWRKEAPDRPFVFIHPASKKLNIWRPGEAKPTEIAKEALQEQYLRDKNFREKIVAIMTPEQARGTDIPLPAGDFINGFTESTEWNSAGQAKARARKLGEQHRVKFVTSSEAHQADYVKMNQAIYTKSSEKQKNNNLKASLLKITSSSTVAARRIMGSEDPIKNDPSYWAESNADQRKIHRQLDREMLPILEKWIIIDNTTNLAMQQTRMISVVAKIKLTIRSEKQKLDTLLEKIEELKVRFPEQKTRIAQLQGIAKEMKDNIDKQEKEFIVEGMLNPKHAPFLPEEVNTSGSEGNSLEQVNEEQISQANNQIQSTNVANEKEEIVVEREPVDSKGIPDKHYRYDRKLPAARGVPHNYGIDRSQFSEKFGYTFDVTQSFFELMEVMPKMLGEPIGRFYILDGKFYVVTVENYHRDIMDDFWYDPQDKFYKSQVKQAVFCPVPSSKAKIGYKLNNANYDVQLDADELKKIVQAKWMMGYTEYSDQESTMLENWLRRLSVDQLRAHKAHLEEKGTQKQLGIFTRILREHNRQI